MRRWQWILIGYLALLAASHAVRVLRPTPTDRGPAVEVGAIDGERRIDDAPVHLAYRQWLPTSGGPWPTILLVHGSPGAASNFEALGPLIGARYRVIALDLPGFGRSSRDIPDVSIRAHAGYVLELLDRLDIGEVHAVGFSMGGGVVLELEELAPERVLSLTLLSAIGVQELELFGQYHLNHAIHGAQLAGLWLLFEGVPHFGLLDGSMLSLGYARNFYDSDQRPLRGILERYAGPMLILHGRDDVLVPYEAAQEHHRIVPQSELVTFEANHFMVFAEPEKLAAPIVGFVDRVEAGHAALRASADPARLAEAAGPDGFHLGRLSGFALVVSMFLIALATFVSEDFTCIAVGLLVAHGRIAFLPGAAACFAGIVLGDLLLYAAGRWLGRPWLAKPPLKWFLSADDLARSAGWFERRGALVIFLSRFIPGTRLPTYVAAGVLRLGFWKFAAYLILPAAIWTPLLVGLADLLGEQVFGFFETFSRYALVGAAAALAIIWIVVGVGRKLFTHKGRRQLVGGWRRKVTWEFWPPWAFYPPVALYVLWLGLRYRSLTLFTLSNPAIPESGFIGESKSQILAGLDPRWVARYRTIPADLPLAERIAAAQAFRAELGLGFPIVLKPDAGQRGSGVAIARSEDDIAAYFRDTPHDAIVQEHVSGPELGVFYVRRPDEEHGSIFSITDKRMPEVVGDGVRNLERLILDDPRAVAMSRAYSERLRDRLEDVPKPGERVTLVEIGTHCQGSIFLDGEQYRTPELEAAIDAIGRDFEGFYFGRFDLRAPSHQAFREGRDMKVLELNGVTSEATHIYDPRNSLFTAYHILFRQWRLAFEIGDQNRDRGLRPTSVRELLRLLLEFRRRG